MSAILNGKAALIVGTWDETVRAVASRLAAEGMLVVLAVHLSPGGPPPVFPREAASIRFVPEGNDWDPADEEHFRALTGGTSVDLLYLNPHVALEETGRVAGGAPPAEFSRVVRFAMGVLPRMMRRGGGRVILNASFLDEVAQDEFLLEQLTRRVVADLARTLARYGITVNALKPAPDGPAPDAEFRRDDRQARSAKAMAIATLHLARENGRTLSGRLLEVRRLTAPVVGNVPPAKWPFVSTVRVAREAADALAGHLN